MPGRLHFSTSPPHFAELLVALLVCALLLLMWAPSAGAAMVVDRCGLEVPDGETAFLVGDLDCTGTGVEGVVLGHRSRLLLSGFSLVADPTEEGGRQGVRCRTGTVCSVIGPGAIVGFAASGVAGTRVRLRDVFLAGNGRNGVAAFENVVLRGVEIGENGGLSVHAGGRVRIRRSRVAGLDRGAVVAEHAPPYRPHCAEN
ncbi:MAG: hypothetical protein D6760_05085 [Deltaproteobacteria bacterium]|nr:MAG: hypothetical protein D6760_05085 [Deltaproteobacteria bacterium]